MQFGNLGIITDDIVEWSKNYTGDKFHAVLTDSPYEYGFLDRDWDATGVSTNPNTWAGIANHMYPGAFGMTYGGSRTWHRIAVAIEMAGLIIHPTIFCWTYASGLHKGKRIDTIIDREAGATDQREIIEKSSATYGYQKSGKRWTKDHFVTKPATEEAMDWWEYRYGIQALRPAVEPIIMFQKPYEGKWTDSIRKYGAGALHIEAAKYANGKWPTNFLIVHHPMCTKEQCDPACNVQAIAADDDKFLTFYPDSSTMGNIQSVMYSKKSLGNERTVAIDNGVYHPTIKPLAVNMWLAALLLPPPKYAPRRILVPFGGVMSEAIASIFAGWESVMSVEINQEYANAGANRAKWWISMAKKHGPNIDKILSTLNGEDDEGLQQLTLNL